MTLDDLAGRQCDRAGLFQKRVQTHQHARLDDRGWFLYLDHIAMLEGLHKVSLHITIGLSAAVFIFYSLGKLPYLFRHTVKDDAHAIL